MQIDTDFLQSALYIVLNALGMFGLLIILAYTVYGTDPTEEE